MNFCKYKRTVSGFARSNVQLIKEPKDFTFSPPPEAGFYWVWNRTADHFDIELFPAESDDTRLRSVDPIPPSLDQYGLIAALRACAGSATLLLSGGGANRIQLNIEWGNVPEELKEYLHHDGRKVYLPL